MRAHKDTSACEAAEMVAPQARQQAGKKLKQPQAYLSRVERSERGVDAIELSDFAKLYGKSMDYFIK